MEILILGLVIFLGSHSTGLFAPDWRDRMVTRLGAPTWKVAYAAVSLVGFVLIIWGYGLARGEPIWLWHPPVWTRHLAALLTLPAFILLVATYVPGSRIKAKVGHPMVLGTKIWAFAHLLANGTVADVLLFGAFLVWAIAAFAIMRRRDRLAGVTRDPGSLGRDGITLVVGLVAWVVFALYLHQVLIGVAPMGAMG
ncbi:NnrU family protein [Marinimicrobium locisalis]|uniref:NnrU family protein n=1 Tax=Marinimicrobium locisalis TaxID=546022 RepID=UPI0032215636